MIKIIYRVWALKSDRTEPVLAVGSGHFVHGGAPQHSIGQLHIVLSMAEQYFVGVDVGTGSVRAVLVDKAGKILSSRTQSTKTFRDDRDHRIFEQSTSDIWSGICACIKYTISEAGVDKKDIKGIGFDATCSLAVTDLQGNPVTITKGNELGQLGDKNIILWADHRAEKEAELINSTGSMVLDYVGGTMSVSCF